MRRRHRRNQGTVELDITAFLNLMIVLVPVLLLSMVFTQTRAIGLDFADQQAGPEGVDVEQVQLQVILSENAIEVASSHEGIIERIPAESGHADYVALTEALKRIKTRMPEKQDIALLASPDIKYQQLVSAMDAIRSFPAVVAASVVQAELFPNIALGDAPEVTSQDEGVQ